MDCIVGIKSFIVGNILFLTLIWRDLDCTHSLLHACVSIAFWVFKILTFTLALFCVLCLWIGIVRWSKTHAVLVKSSMRWSNAQYQRPSIRRPWLRHLGAAELRRRKGTRVMHFLSHFGALFGNQGRIKWAQFSLSHPLVVLRWSCALVDPRTNTSSLTGSGQLFSKRRHFT